MSIYTRRGDDGTTDLYGGSRIPKSHPRLKAIGDLDELNAHIGLVLSQLSEYEYEENEEISQILLQIQNDLMNIGSHLAVPYVREIPAELAPFDETATRQLEEYINALDEELPELRSFIIPTGTLLAAQIHVCRTVCRRAERSVATLVETENILPSILHYLNRLSDFLFTLARKINADFGVEEKLW